MIVVVSYHYQYYLGVLLLTCFASAFLSSSSSLGYGSGSGSTNGSGRGRGRGSRSSSLPLPLSTLQRDLTTPTTSTSRNSGSNSRIMNTKISKSRRSRSKTGSTSISKIVTSESTSSTSLGSSRYSSSNTSLHATNNNDSDNDDNNNQNNNNNSNNNIDGMDSLECDDRDDELMAVSTTSTLNTVENENNNDNANINDSNTTTTIATTSNSNSDSNDNARWNRRKQIALGLGGAIIITVGMAKIGWIPGPLHQYHDAVVDSITTTTTDTNNIMYDTYTNSMIGRDVFMTVLTSILAVGMNRMITLGYNQDWYDSKTARKITHILSAPLFIVCWPFFSNAAGAKYFAGLVTFTNLCRLYLAGTGDQAESSLVQTISRSGDRSEILGGPFIYVCIFQCCILAFWRTSLVGVVAMTTMAAGDGMADIIGRRYGTEPKDKWSSSSSLSSSSSWAVVDPTKSKIGTVAFIVSSFICTFGIIQWLLATDALPPSALCYSLDTAQLALRILLISTICGFIEIVPFFGDDNYTVPGSAAILAAVLLQ